MTAMWRLAEWVAARLRRRNGNNPMTPDAAYAVTQPALGVGQASPPPVKLGGLALSLAAVAVVLGGAVFQAREWQQQRQLSTALEQLGSDKIGVRLAGIYALEDQMGAIEVDRAPMLEALTIFVHGQTDHLSAGSDIGVEAQTALRVIGRRDNPMRDFEERIDLSSAYLEGLNLAREEIELAKGDKKEWEVGPYIKKSDFRGANFWRADLARAQFPSVLLDTADFGQANLTSANFTYAHLHWANFEGTRAIGTSFKDAELGGASFVGADVTRADFDGANLDGTAFNGVDLSKAVNLDQHQLNQACGDDKTVLPRGLKINTNCLPYVPSDERPWDHQKHEASAQQS